MRHVPFRCPRCGKPVVKVAETREWQGTIRRVRVCENGHRNETRERMHRAEDDRAA